jgi:hypothetical protein
MNDKDKSTLGSLSPAYGMMTGQGAFGKMADSGLGGIVPTMLSEERRKKKDGTPMTKEEEMATQNPQAMKKGGKVSSASKRADGCAVRGKTRGKIV